MGRGATTMRRQARAALGHKTISRPDAPPGGWSDFVQAEAQQLRRQHAARTSGVRPPTPLRVAVVAFVWIVAVACVVYPWVLWSLM